MKFEHTLSELRVCDDASILLEERAREARLDVHFASIDAAQERANDSLLVLRAAQVMVQNVRYDRWVNIARQVLDVDAVVEIRQVGLLSSGLNLLTHRVRLSCLNHVQLGVLSRGVGRSQTYTIRLALFQ